jgi:hypothetical protein
LDAATCILAVSPLEAAPATHREYVLDVHFDAVPELSFRFSAGNFGLRTHKELDFFTIMSVCTVLAAFVMVASGEAPEKDVEIDSLFFFPLWPVQSGQLQSPSGMAYEIFVHIVST